MNPWTPETDAKLRAMFLAGKSDATIAMELGVTKNSALGRRQRLGLKREAVRTRGIAKPKAASPAPNPSALLIGPAGSCRFIERDGPGFFRDGDPYCGAKVAAPGESWCPEHRARCFTGVSLRRLVAA